MTRVPTHPKPKRPQFSCGPTVKRPGWSPSVLASAALGRWHRSPEAARKLEEAMALTRALAAIPDDFSLLLLPGSNTGAFETAMWNLLGPVPVTVLAFDSFGQDWLFDVVTSLKITTVDARLAPWGELPNLEGIPPANDVVCVWNGTTAGVCLPDGDWIAPDREGLVLCDATSAIFGLPLPWARLDAVSFSWQKMLGGEGAHGMLALGPRARARLAGWVPPWPLPKLMRLRQIDRVLDELMAGHPINTFSLLALEDYLDALRWAKGLGVDGLAQRVSRNFAAIAAGVTLDNGLEFAVTDPAHRSVTSVTLRPADPEFALAAPAAQRGFVKSVAERLAHEGVALDIEGYRRAPPGFRIWAGATVDSDDLTALMPWLAWAVRNQGWD